MQNVYPVAAPSRQGADNSVWVLVILVVAIVGGVAGFAWANYGKATWDDLENAKIMSEREGMLRGQQNGYFAGAKAGRNEAKAKRRYEIQRGAVEDFRNGFNAGVNAGRDRAAAAAGDDSTWFGLSSGLDFSGSLDDPTTNLIDPWSDLGAGVGGSVTNGWSSQYGTDSAWRDSDSASEWYRGGSRPYDW